MQRLTIDNNVRVTLNTGINSSAASIIFDSAAAPYRNPPAPVGDAPGLITLADSLSNPTKIEIVTYTGVSGNTLTGCLRGRDGTTAQSWSAGTHMICAPTRALVDPANVLLSDSGSIRSASGVQTLTLDSTQPATALDVSRYHTFYLKLRVDNVSNGAPAEIQYPVTITGLAAGDRASVILVLYGPARTPAFSPPKGGILVFSQYPEMNDMSVAIGASAATTYVYPVTFFGGTTFALNPVQGSAPGNPFNIP